MRLQICSWKAQRKIFTAALHPLWRISPLQFLRLLSSKGRRWRNPHTSPWQSFSSSDLSPKERGEKKNQKENIKKSQKTLKNSSLAKIFFSFKNIHNYIEQTRTPKCKTRKKHKTHTQRDPQAEMHCLKGELVERECMFQRRERDTFPRLGICI